MLHVRSFFGHAASPSPETPPLSVVASEAAKGKRLSLYNYAAGFAFADAMTLIIVGVVLSGAVSGARSSGDALAGWQFWAIGFALCTHFAMARILNVYSTTTILAGRKVVRRLLVSFVLSFAFMLTIAVATKTSESYSRLWFFSWFFISVCIVLLVRIGIVEYVRRLMKNGAYVYKAMSIGVFCDPIRSTEIRRQSNNEVHVATSLQLQALDELASLSDSIAQNEIDRVYVAAPWAEIPVVLSNLHLLRHLSTRVFVLPGDRHARLDLHGLSFLGDRPLFCALEEPIHGWGLWLKRMEDIVVAAFAIVVLSPVLLLTALAIRLDSPGPIFFRQVRAGFNGKTFLLWKFRTMFAEATDPHAKVQTIKNDPRVTRIGRFLRRMSIDELPQLFNVIEGTMSLVGPRPHALLTKTQGKNLEELVDYYAVRHRVRPGMTGWAQVHGFRGELDSVDKLQSRVDYDLDYINRWTIWLDLKILFRTASLVLRDCRAY